MDGEVATIVGRGRRILKEEMVDRLKICPQYPGEESWL